MTCPFGYGQPQGPSPTTAQAQTMVPQENFPAKTSESREGAKVHYPGYLHLDKVLGAQHLLSHDPVKNMPVHDEHLFIVIHQAYELWFKQILWEVSSVIGTFHQYTDHRIDANEMLTVCSRLRRVVSILKVCNAQFEVLETMTSMDFLEFRNFLAPASGFQSSQFRLVENMIGQRPESRVKYQKEHYWKHLGTDEEKARVRNSEDEVTLRECVDKWLQSMPGKTDDGYDFFESYKDATRSMLRDQRDAVMKKPTDEALAECTKNEASYEQIFNEELYNVAVERGDRRFSHAAIKGLLMIMHYRDHPLMNLPYTMLVRLMDIDQHLMTFRINHAQLVQRMIGNRMGTGGSSGYMYLRSTCSDRYKIFLDIFQISAYMLPNCWRPVLPDDLASQLTFAPRTAEPFATVPGKQV